MLSTSDLDEKHRRLWENTTLTIVIDTLTMKSKKKKTIKLKISMVKKMMVQRGKYKNASAV